MWRSCGKYEGTRVFCLREVAEERRSGKKGSRRKTNGKGVDHGKTGRARKGKREGEELTGRREGDGKREEVGERRVENRRVGRIDEKATE